MEPKTPKESPNPTHFSSIKSVKQNRSGNIEGMVIKIGDIREVALKTGQVRNVQSITVQDLSDSLTITLWEQNIFQDLDIEDKIQIRGLYVKYNFYSKHLEGSLSRDGRIRRIPWPLSLSIPHAEQKVLIELKRLVKHNLLQFPQITAQTFGLKLDNNHVIGLGLYLQGIPSLPESIGDLTHLQCLHVPNNHLTCLPPSICTLSRLQTLNIEWNRLRELPPQLGDLSNLQQLNICENQIRILPESLEKCKKLTRLECDHNPIERFSESLPLHSLSKYSAHIPSAFPDQEKKALIFLELQLQVTLPELTHINQKSLGYMKHGDNVVGIGLYLQHLRKFPSVLFNFHHLQVLNIAWNHLEDIPPIGDRLPLLSKMFLRNNRWDRLPSTISRFLSRRYSRDITNILEIEVILELETMLDEIIPRLLPANIEKSFGFVIDAGHITEIYLDCKNLDDLPKSFRVCTHLHTISANSNNFQKFPSVLSSCKELSHIIMGSNSISQIPSWISELKKMEKLDLQYNQLSHIPPELTHLCNLHTLNLRSNKILALPNAFGNLQALQRVDLGNNELTTLPESFSSLTHLTHLYLNQNQLALLPREILQLQSLEEIDLLWNKIQLSPQEVEAIHAKLRYENYSLRSRSSDIVNYEQLNLPVKELQGLVGLEILLGKRLVISMPRDRLTFRKFGVAISDGHVTSLSLPNSSLNIFPEIIGNFRHLQMLSLPSNNISVIPHVIGTFRILHTLHLNSNSISEISDLIGNLASLKIFNLNNNKMEFLPDGFSNLQNLEDCKLEHNPWQDIPHVLWNLHKLKKLRVNIRDFPAAVHPVIRGGISTILDFAYRRAFFYDEVLQKLERNHKLNAFDLSHPQICKYAPMLEEKCQELNNIPAKQLLALFNEKCFIQKEQFKIWL